MFQSNPLCQYTCGDSPRVIKDMDLSSWFATDDLSENLRTVVPHVILMQEAEPNSISNELCMYFCNSDDNISSILPPWEIY